MYHNGIAFLLNLLQARKNINTAESKTNLFTAVCLYKYLFKNSLPVQCILGLWNMIFTLPMLDELH